MICVNKHGWRRQQLVVLGLSETFKRVLDGAFSRLPYLGEMESRLKRNPLGQVYFQLVGNRCIKIPYHKDV
jgi:hypothetical protein